MRWRRANADAYVFAALKAKDFATLLHIHTLQLYQITTQYEAQYLTYKMLQFLNLLYNEHGGILISLVSRGIYFQQQCKNLNIIQL